MIIYVNLLERQAFTMRLKPGKLRWDLNPSGFW